MVIQCHLHVDFFTVSCCITYTILFIFETVAIMHNQNFCMKFFTTPNSKNLIATLRIATLEGPELTFLLILYFHVL